MINSLITASQSVMAQNFQVAVSNNYTLSEAAFVFFAGGASFVVGSTVGATAAIHIADTVKGNVGIEGAIGYAFIGGIAGGVIGGFFGTHAMINHIQHEKSHDLTQQESFMATPSRFADAHIERSYTDPVLKKAMKSLAL